MKPFAAALLVAALAGPLLAQPDVIVGDLTGPANYGSLNGVTAYSVGTTSCNVGTVPLQWIWNTPAHPVIGQNMYRLRNGRFEQIGQSWLKHGFTALQQTLCGTCQSNPNGSALGVGCSDPYSAALNGQQSGLGPRFEVNPSTGAFPYPFTGGSGGSILDKRIQVRNSDIDPLQNNGARYFAEGQYIHPDDAGSGNDMNNASYREFVVVNPTTFDLQWSGNTVRTQPAIYAWQAYDPAVTIQTVDVPNDGRFIIAWNATPSGVRPGFTHYEVAIHNLNSHASAGGVDFNWNCGAPVVQGAYFHDVDYHSGEPYQNTDWVNSYTTGRLRFSNGQNFAVNPNANALRWGTLYNFAFDTDTPPNSLTINLWRPAAVPSVTVALGGGVTGPEYQVNGFAIRADVNGVQGTTTTPALVALNRGQTGAFTVTSIGTGLSWEVLYGTNALVPRSACALTTLDAQVINIDLTDPTVGLWFNTFQSPPFQNVTLPFSFGFPANVAVQSAILNPTSLAGLSLSQATRVSVP